MAKRKNKVVVNFVLDETSSMWGVRDATIDGFNEYLSTLKSDEKVNFLFSLTKFNSEKVDTVNVCDPVSKVKELNHATYGPNGMTPLYDAIGQTVIETEKRLKEIKGKPSVLCVIQTDGQENCSREFNLEKIRSLISEKEKDGWTFLYLGADQNAWQSGSFIGISKDNTASYSNTSAGSQAVFDRLGSVTVAYADDTSNIKARGGTVTSNTAMLTSAGTGGLDLREGDLGEPIGVAVSKTDTDE
jgi:hypothetical protein